VITADKMQELVEIVRAAHPEDGARLDAMFAARDGVTLAYLIRDYYRDADRAGRAPRELLYVHLGTLGGVIERLMDVLQLPKVVH
jgi:hypothetical protein